METAEELHQKYPQVKFDEIVQMLRKCNKKDVEKRLNRKYGPPQVPLTHNQKVGKLVEEFDFLSKKEIEKLLNTYLDNLENVRQVINEDQALKKLISGSEFKEEEDTMTQDDVEKEMSENGKETCLFDLHKYSLKSAQRLVRDIFSVLKKGEYQRADIITGKGKHSPDGIAHIRAYVIKTAVNKMRWRAVMNDNNTGLVSVYPHEKVSDDEYIDENEVFYGK